MFVLWYRHGPKRHGIVAGEQTLNEIGVAYTNGFADLFDERSILTFRRPERNGNGCVHGGADRWHLNRPAAELGIAGGLEDTRN